MAPFGGLFSSKLKPFFTFAVALVIILQLTPRYAPSPHLSNTSQISLCQQAMIDIFQRAAPIAGINEGCSQGVATCDWMAQFPDDTLLVHMNLPGTHDSATWNYTDATQAALIGYTGPLPDASFFQCQEHSLLQSLNEGIRVFDLRFAYNPGNDTIGFYHSNALLSPTTRMQDVFFALYTWLEQHPTEAVLLSLNHESGTGTPENAALYEMVYDILNTPLAERYWVQTNGTLGTLGEARGKLTLLQRFSYSLLPSNLTKRIGIFLDPNLWTDNDPNIQLVYNNAQSQVAYIEDYYELSNLPIGTSTADYISAKFNATTNHITAATNSNPDQLYISFASAAYILGTSIIPRVFAVGNGTDVPGMNQQLLPWLQQRKGSRFGIIMFDFYDVVPGLVEAAIGL